MFASNNILSLLMSQDAIVIGESVAKDSVTMPDYEAGLFQQALMGAEKDEQDQTVLLDFANPNTGRFGIDTFADIRTHIEVESEASLPLHQKEELPDADEILSTLSFLSVANIASPKTAYQPFQGTLPAWNLEPSTPAHSALSDQEMTILTLLENSTPSYVAQTTELEMGFSHNAATMDDSDLDTLISSILLSTRKETPRDASALADLSWNHFNDTILTDADQIENDLQGFTFEVAGMSEGLAKDVKSERVSLPASSVEPFRIKMPAELAESVVAHGQMQSDINAILNEDDFLTALTDSKPHIDSSALEHIGSQILQQKIDGVKTSAYTPEWRPNDQIMEHNIVQQVANKLSMHRLNSKGNDGITIELEPKDLGALKIEISVHKNFVFVDILTPHSAVRDILDKNQVLLRDAMANMGFTVDQFSVNVGDFSHLPKPFSGQEQFNDAYGTKFALRKESPNSDALGFAIAGKESRYWGYTESGVSIYV